MIHKELAMEYTKNRLKYHLLFFFLCIVTVIKAEKDIIPFVYNVVPVIKDVKFQQWVAQSRLIIMPVMLGITLYCCKNHLMEYVTDYPIPFLAFSFLIGNFLTDSVFKYRQINQAVQFFLFSQAMSRHLLCMIAVKNKMQRISLIKGTNFNEQEYLRFIMEKTGHTIEELELLIFELLNSSMNSINHLCVNVNTTDIEEKIYFLFKEQITIEQMLLVCKNDENIYDQLFEFHNDPEQNYEYIMETLCVLIHAQFNSFMKKKLHIYECCV